MSFHSTDGVTPTWPCSHPGVTQDPRGLTSGSNCDLAFGGIRGFQSSYLVDGGDTTTRSLDGPAGAITRPTVKVELMAESFNLLNRDNKRVQITQDGFISNSAGFVQTTNTTGINIFPA